MPSSRKERVANIIKRELSKIISKEFDFPEGLVTITFLSSDENLNQAKVGVSVFPSEHGELAIKELQKNEKFFYRKLLKSLRLRTIPKIFFILDRGPESGAQVEKLLLNE